MAATEDINIADSVYNNIFDCIGNLSAKEVRGCSLDASTHRTRSPLISSSKDSEDYHVQVQRESDKMVKDEPVTSSNSSI